MVALDLVILFSNLNKVSSYKNIDTEDALAHLAKFVDASNDLSNTVGLVKAIHLGLELETRTLSSIYKVSLFYYLGMAWDGLRIKINSTGNNNIWNLKQIELENILFYLRAAINEPDFQKATTLLKCNIYTTYANNLDTIGRFVEALEYWEKVIQIDPSFLMVKFNRAIGIINYSRNLYDHGHHNVFVKIAYSEYQNLLGNKLFDKQYPGVLSDVQNRIDALEKSFEKEDLQARYEFEDYPLGESEEEIAYRTWCLENKLFLNPLNDLGVNSIAARDILTTPNISTPLDVGPRYQGFYNQLKQEFITARFLLYEGISYKKAYYADKNVYQYDTLDFPIYSISIEKVKLALRSAYSIFDKIAFFINEYLDIGIPAGDVNFGTLWLKKGNLRPEFENRKNLPLRGLFWVSRDFFDRQPSFINSDEKEIKNLRRHLEHRYLKVHEDNYFDLYGKSKFTGISDDLAFSISRTDLENKALKTLKLIRSSLIYLSLCIHIEEQIRKAEKKPGIEIPQFLGKIDDDTKI